MISVLGKEANVSTGNGFGIAILNDCITRRATAGEYGYGTPLGEDRMQPNIRFRKK